MDGKVTVDVAAVRARLGRLTQVAAGEPGFMKALAVQLYADTARWIKAGGGGGWKPLTAWTQAGKRKGGGGLPLQGFLGKLRWEVTATTAEVVVDHFAAKWQHEGTPGPYPIRPKVAKALALPWFKGLASTIAAPHVGRGEGHFSLAGLGRSRPTGRGGFVFRPAPGQRISPRLAGRIGRTVQARKSLVFFGGVMHPGLPPRPLFPSDQAIYASLGDAARAYLRLTGRST